MSCKLSFCSRIRTLGVSDCRKQSVVIKQSKLRPIYVSVSIDSSTFVNKFYVHCLCYQLTANTATCIFSDCGSIMSLKGYYALKCVGARFICGDYIYRPEISKFRVEISKNVLLRDVFCFYGDDYEDQ